MCNYDTKHNANAWNRDPQQRAENRRCLQAKERKKNRNILGGLAEFATFGDKQSQLPETLSS